MTHCQSSGVQIPVHRGCGKTGQRKILPWGNVHYRFSCQDIFGGKVYGVLRPGGNYHCYNVIGDWRFDLTSEQFGGKLWIMKIIRSSSGEVHLPKRKKGKDMKP